jgi:hypothetical protein
VNKNHEWEWIEISKGKRAAVAKYKDHKLPEYNSNPMIQALPPILSRAEFTEYVTRYPDFAPEEREFDAHYRFHCIERLSRYFDPLNKTIDLQQGLFQDNGVKCSLSYRKLSQNPSIKSKRMIFVSLLKMLRRTNRLLMKH